MPKLGAVQAVPLREVRGQGGIPVQQNVDTSGLGVIENVFTAMQIEQDAIEDKKKDNFARNQVLKFRTSLNAHKQQVRENPQNYSTEQNKKIIDDLKNEGLAGIDSERIDNAKADFDYYGVLADNATSDDLNNFAVNESLKILDDEISLLGTEPDSGNALEEGSILLAQVSDDLSPDGVAVTENKIREAFKSQLELLEGSDRERHLNNLLNNPLVEVYFPNKKDRLELRDNANFSFALKDAGSDYESANRVLNNLDPSDKAYDLSPQAKTKTYNAVLSIVNRERKTAKINAERLGVEGHQSAQQVVDSTGTYEDKYYQIERMAVEFGFTEKEKKSYHLVNSTAHGVDAQTSADVLLNLQERLKGLDLRTTKKAEDTYMDYLKNVRSLVVETNKSYSDGNLSYPNYRQIVEDIKIKTANKNSAVAGEYKEEDTVWGWGYDETDAYADFLEKASSTADANNLFIDYYSVVGGSDMNGTKREAKADQLIKSYEKRKKSKGLIFFDSIGRGYNVTPEILKAYRTKYKGKTDAELIRAIRNTK